MSFVAELESHLGVSLITDPDITSTYSKDQAPFASYSPAAAVLLARTTEEISKALAFCSERKIPVVTRGAGSGLSGGANADSKSLVISLEKMNQILEIDPANQLARVQAGVINLDLDTAVKEFGMAYLPDPASRDWSTLGGNVATNAGGMCCVKYGVTSHHVRALKVVLSSGEVIEVGKATKKFVVEEIGTGGEFTCTLATGKLPAALVAGEMSIMALGNDAETYNVAKISAKRVTLANPSATGNNVLGGLSQAWQMGAAASAGVVRIEEAGDDNTLVGTDDDDFTEDA